MRKQYIALGVFIIVALGFLFWWQVSQAGVGNLNIYSGSAEVFRKNKNLSGRTGLPIKVEDVVQVQRDSRVAIVLKDSSVIRLEAGSEVEVGELTYEGKKIKRAAFALKLGRLWSTVDDSSGANFNVETPSMVASVRGTSYNTDYLNASSRVYVESNAVKVALKSNRASFKAVLAGQLFTIHDGRLQEDFDRGPVPAPPEFFDNWIQFNQEEDRKLLSGSINAEIETKAELIIGGKKITIIKAIAYRGTFLSLDQLILESGETACGEHYHAKAGFVVATDSTRVPDPGPPCGFGAKDQTAVVDVTTEEVENIQPSSQTTQPNATVKGQTATTPTSTKQVKSIRLTATEYTLNINDSVLLIPEATFSDGSVERVGDRATWAQASEIGSIKNQGWFTGTAAGTTKVKASFEGVTSNEISLTVEALKKMIGLDVTYAKNPPAYTAYDSLPTVQFVATANYDDGSRADITNQITWSVWGTAGGTIDASGLYTPSSQGSIHINAAYQTVSNSAVVAIP